MDIVNPTPEEKVDGHKRQKIDEPAQLCCPSKIDDKKLEVKPSVNKEKVEIKSKVAKQSAEPKKKSKYEIMKEVELRRKKKRIEREIFMNKKSELDAIFDEVNRKFDLSISLFSKQACVLFEDQDRKGP